MVRAALFTVGTLLLAGCGTTWTKQGATLQERDMALSRCRAISWQTLPAAPVRYQVSPAGYTSNANDCKRSGSGSNDCRPTQVYRGAVYKTRDANEDGRDSIEHDCMMSNGWSPNR